MINNVIDYFNLRPSAGAPEGHAAGGASFGFVAGQYLALLAGIVVQPFLAKFQEKGAWDLTGLSGWLLFSAIVGLLVFPAVYKNSVDPDKPFFIQLCTVFAGGIGWQSLMKTALTATGLTPTG